MSELERLRAALEQLDTLRATIGDIDLRTEWHTRQVEEHLDGIKKRLNILLKATETAAWTETTGKEPTRFGFHYIDTWSAFYE